MVIICLHSMQVISLSRLLCGSLSDMQLMEDQAEYILPITDGNITLKHYLWAVLLIIECFFFFLSLLLSQYREKLKNIFEETGNFLIFSSHFLQTKKSKRNPSSSLLLKKADFQLTLLPKLMRLVIN